MNYDYELIVIGAGSGGVRASRLASELGKKVAVIESSKLGGTCVNLGCVPKKLFYYASHFTQDFKIASSFGWKVSSNQFSFQQLVSNKNTEIERLNNVYKQLLENAGVDIILGKAQIVGKNEVKVDSKIYTTKYILIASGSKPHIPDIEGREYAISSNDCFFLDAIPEKIVIVGAGYIALEFASIFNALGAQTVLVHRSDRMLRAFDQEIAEFLLEEMKKKGVEFKLNLQVQKIVKMQNKLLVHLNSGESIGVDHILFATGRVPNCDCIDKTKIKLETIANRIKVNELYQSSQNNIYAIGDVSNKMNLTPVAIREAIVVVNHLFKGVDKPLDYSNIPTAIFSQPNIGTVGLTEEQAKQQYEIEVYKTSFRPMKFSLSNYSERTFMKMIVDKKSSKVLGVHMVGQDAGETIQGIAVAIKTGATKTHFDATVGIHPTSAEEFVTM